MWWESLGILDALNTGGSMSSAARMLGVDKATVSRRMAELNRSAPAPLFESRSQGIALTPYGVRAIEAFREHERSRMRLQNELEATDHDTKGTVRLSMPSFIACDLIVPALPRFSRRHTSIAVHVDATNRVVDLTRDEADIGLRNIRPNEPALSFRQAGRLGLSMYASEEYLARRGGLLGSRDLQGHDLISYDTGPYSGPGFEWLPEAAKKARVIFSANDTLALRDAARAGLGLSVLPHCLGDHTPGLRRVHGGGEGVTSILLVLRAEQRRVPRIRTVLEFIVTLLQRQQARLYAPASAAE